MSANQVLKTQPSRGLGSAASPSVGSFSLNQGPPGRLAGGGLSARSHAPLSCPQAWGSQGPGAALSLIPAHTPVKSAFTKSPQITSLEHPICLLLAL